MDEKLHFRCHDYTSLHCGWGGFSEELLFYTSRYYAVTEAFLGHLSNRLDFRMSDYKASELSEAQRTALTYVLEYEPNSESANAIISIIEAVSIKSLKVDEAVTLQFPTHGKLSHASEFVGHTPKHHPLDVSSLDPMLNMAEHLLMAVAVREHHIELDMKLLAKTMDSSNSVIRNNLQKCIIDLHEAGYRLRNHPHLSHAEAYKIGDEGAV